MLAEQCPVSAPADRAPISISVLDAVLNPSHYTVMILVHPVPDGTLFSAIMTILPIISLSSPKGHERAPGSILVAQELRTAWGHPLLRPLLCLSTLHSLYHCEGFLSQSHAWERGLERDADGLCPLQEHHCLIMLKVAICRLYPVCPGKQTTAQHPWATRDLSVRT